MNKILTKEQREKKESRNRLIIGIVLVGILVLSTAGYAFFGREETSSGTGKIEYNGITFVLGEDLLWHTNINNVEFSFVYNPKDAENISSNEILTLTHYKDKPLYYEYQSDTQALSEILRNIGRYAERIQPVCIGECEEDYPVKNCTSNVIIIKEANDTLIKQEENCIYINGKADELLRASDSFIYRILKII